MTAPRLRIAQLDEAGVAKVKALEGELATWVVALEPQVKLADLSEVQLKKLQAVEEELGVVLIGYKA